MVLIVKTMFITWMYCIVWALLEVVLYGQTEKRMVDDIMMLLFIPIIYVAMDKPNGG